MKKVLLKAAAILLIVAGIAACGKKENSEPPLKLAWTEWSLAGHCGCSNRHNERI